MLKILDWWVKAFGCY